MTNHTTCVHSIGGTWVRNSLSGFFALLLACLLALTPFCKSECFASTKSPVEISVGVNGQYKEGTWTHVRLRISPDLAQAAPFDIELVMSWYFQGRRQPLRRYSKMFERNGTGTPAEVSIPVYLSSDTNHILVYITKDGRQLFSEGRLLEQIEKRWSSFILILTSHPERFNIIPNLKIEQNVETIIVSPEELGDNWTFFEAASCVIVDDVELASLAHGKLDALETWLFTGGNILFTADGLVSNKESKLIGTRAGFRIGGMRRIVSPTVLSAFCDEEPDLITRLDVLEVTAAEKDIWLMADGAPLILLREAGLGSLWAFTFKPDELSLTNQRRFDPLQRTLWTLILKNFIYRGKSLNWNESIALTPEAEMGKLAGPVALYLLVLLIVLGPINYVVLRKLDKREYILLTVPVITIVLGIAAFIVALTIKGDKVIKVSRTVTTGKAGDTIFDHRQYLGILSPRKARFSLSASDDKGRIPQVIEPLTQSWNETQEIGRFPVRIAYLDGRVDVSDIEIPMWGMEFLQLVSAAEYEAGIECSMHLEQDILTGLIENSLPFDLQECFVVFRHNKCALGDIPQHEKRQFEVKVLPPPSLSEKRLSGNEKRAARGNVFHKMFWDETTIDESRRKVLNHVFGIYRGYFEHPVLIGWMECPLPLKTTTGEREVTETQSNLILVRLPLFLSKTKEMNIPIGVSARTCIEGRWCNAFAPSVSPSPYGEYKLELDLPFDAHERFEIENLTVHMTRPPAKEFANEGEPEEEPTLAVSIYHWEDDTWAELQRTKEEELHHEIGEKPDNYVKFPRGLIRLKVEMSDAGSLRPPGVSGRDVFSAFMDSPDFDPEEFADLFAFDSVPLILLDVSMKGHFSGE